MTQDQCLSLPSHFTHLGVCYPGSVAIVQLSSANDPQPATFAATSVPEPATSAMFALALILCLFAHIRPRGGAKLG